MIDGTALVLEQPLSLWGGMDPATGDVIDAHHPQRGANLAGRVVVMPAARGSSSSASILAEAVRAGCAPLAILIGPEGQAPPAFTDSAVCWQCS